MGKPESGIFDNLGFPNPGRPLLTLLKTTTVIFNGYDDGAKFDRLTPYLGAGVGLARTRRAASPCTGARNPAMMLTSLKPRWPITNSPWMPPPPELQPTPPSICQALPMSTPVNLVERTRCAPDGRAPHLVRGIAHSAQR
jgi:hypothetical protein